MPRLRRQFMGALDRLEPIVRVITLEMLWVPGHSNCSHEYDFGS